MDPHATGGSGQSFALDIWSLGVILFELCTFFSTRMERIVALSALREGGAPDAEFAARWPRQAGLMAEMLDPVAERRPSARALLERLPPQEDDENLKDALRVLSQPHSTHYSLLMENLFAPERVLLPPLPPGADEGLVPGTGLHRGHCSTLLLQPQPYLLHTQRAHESLGAIFRRHGAVELTLPPVWYKQSPAAAGSPESSAPFVIDSGGHLLGLHTGGRLPLCHYLALHSPVATFKRFTLGVAHVRPPPTPKHRAAGLTTQLVADFDVVSPPGAADESGAGTVVEAELLRVAVNGVSSSLCL